MSKVLTEAGLNRDKKAALFDLAAKTVVNTIKEINEIEDTPGIEKVWGVGFYDRDQQSGGEWGWYATFPEAVSGWVDAVRETNDDRYEIIYRESDE